MSEIDTTKRDRYFLRVGSATRWQEVTKEEWVSAERSAGFHNTMGRPDEPATAGFSNGSVSGTLRYRGERLPIDFIPLEGEPEAKEGADSSPAGRD